MIQKGTTQSMEEGTFEAHRIYMDIQILVEGSEAVAWAKLSDLKEEIAYNEEKDAARYTGENNHTIHVTAGMCYVAYPHDGHKPVRHVDQQQSYTKIVMKLPLGPGIVLSAAFLGTGNLVSPSASGANYDYLLM